MGKKRTEINRPTQPSLASSVTFDLQAISNSRERAFLVFLL